MISIDGILRCSRYSFGPNRLHYCGPDQNVELRALIEAGEMAKDSGLGLTSLLKQFKTLFPYLRHIAHSNKIADPFDSRVVEAYWLGNSLLDSIEKQKFYDFLVDDLGAKKKTGLKEFHRLEEKIAGATPHHNFHVLNVWTQTGHGDKLDILERMDECRISSGKVVEISGPEITVSAEPLTMSADGRLALGETRRRKITRRFESEYDIEQLRPGQIVSIHWGVSCEVISERQAARLRKYTLRSIDLANGIK